MTTQDERQAAAGRIDELIGLLKKTGSKEAASIIEEAESLGRAISAFHMEGIRFRIFNVDRLLTRHSAVLPQETRALLEDARKHLEAAGFHTRSHQSPV
jgi:hypothetical protein